MCLAKRVESDSQPLPDRYSSSFLKNKSNKWQTFILNFWVLSFFCNKLVSFVRSEEGRRWSGGWGLNLHTILTLRSSSVSPLCGPDVWVQKCFVFQVGTITWVQPHMFAGLLTLTTPIPEKTQVYCFLGETVFCGVLSQMVKKKVSSLFSSSHFKWL